MPHKIDIIDHRYGDVFEVEVEAGHIVSITRYVDGFGDRIVYRDLNELCPWHRYLILERVYETIYRNRTKARSQLRSI